MITINDILWIIQVTLNILLIISIRMLNKKVDKQDK